MVKLNSSKCTFCPSVFVFITAFETGSKACLEWYVVSKDQ